MLKNVLLPIILILLTGFGSVYLWFEDAPFSFFGLIGVLALWFGSMYIGFYIAFLLFPHEKNKPLPHLANLVMYYEYDKKNKLQSFTWGEIFGILFTVALWVGGTFSAIKFTERYKKYEYFNYGINSKATIINFEYRRKKIRYCIYEFSDVNGKKHQGEFLNKTLSIGDIIKIRYSKRRPVINKIIEPEEE
jgi:hypothetical protein